MIGNNIDQYLGRYEYRLSFLQVLLNPLGMLLFRVFSLGVLVFCIYLAFWMGYSNYLAWLIPLTLLFFSMSGLFYGYGRWTPSPIWIEFNNEGVTTNYGGLQTKPENPGFPYRLLNVHSGIANAFILGSTTGHTIIIPCSLISKEQVGLLIKERKQVVLK